MTVAEARAALGGGLELSPGADTSACDYATITGEPKGVSIMLESGRVARIDVDSGSVETAEGARIGDTETRIKGLYPNAVATRHKYTDGNYLTVTPAAPADSALRIVFETDGKIVTQYRAGRRPAVEYVEGCS
jgi:hypothetical protein